MANRQPHQDVCGPEVAALIVNFLDGRPSLKANHSGLYLLATEVVYRAEVMALLQEMHARWPNLQAVAYSFNTEPAQIELCRRAGEPDAAAVIINCLDCYPSLRTHHSELYALAKDVVHRKRMDDLRQVIEARHSRGKALLQQIRVAGIFAYRVLRLIYRAGRSLLSLLGNANGKRLYSSVTVYFPSGKTSGPVQS